MARIECSIELNVPVHVAYAQLARFEQYPRFIEDVAEVRRVDETHLHWRVTGGKLDMEWDAEITQQVPDRRIAWRNLGGPCREGQMELRESEGECSRLTLSMECDPRQLPLPEHGDAESMIRARAESDLARFKKFLEKQARDHGEWRGRPSEAQPQPPSAEEGQATGAAVGKTVGRSAAESRAAEPDPGAAIQGLGRKTQKEGQKEAQDEQQAQDGREQKSFDRWMLRPPWMPNLMQVWGEPLGFMRRMSEDMEHVLGRFAGRHAEGGQAAEAAPMQQAGSWTPPVEVAQAEDRFVVCAELAGVRREDVHVDIRSDRITIEGERPRRGDEGGQVYRHSERAYGHFYRSVTLPPGVDTEGASASLHDGLLEITVPFSRAASSARRLDIRS